MRKKLLLSAMCVAMLCSLTACGKEEKKDDSGKIEPTTAVATVGDTGEAGGDTQVVEEAATERAEEAGYITMTPDEIVAKLEEAGFVHSRTSTNTDDENKKSHTYKYDTDDAFTSAQVRYYEDTEELWSYSLWIQTNKEEDLEKFNEIITMAFTDEADKQEFIEFVYKKDVEEGLDEKVEIAGLLCYRQNMNVENSTSGGNYKYSYNVEIYYKNKLQQN